jgi:hypothetical protein
MILSAPRLSSTAIKHCLGLDGAYWLRAARVLKLDG